MTNSLQVNPDRRHVELSGVYNLRDLGGYPTKDGKMTKWEKYYRSDSIHKLTEGGQKELSAKGIQVVVDLRSQDEGVYEFHEDVDIHYSNIPLLNPMEIRQERPKSLVELYYRILDERQASIYEVMKQLVLAGDRPVLFHCKAGKDRTGIIAALLLDLVGVEAKTIAEDYARTEQYIGPIRDELLSNRTDYLDEEHYKPLLECPPEFMLSFLSYLYEKYQSSEQYLRLVGLQEDEISQLKNHFKEI